MTPAIKAADKLRVNWRFMIAVLVCLTATVEAKYSGGTGEPNDPYKIATTANLLTLANDANDYNKCFILTADIDLDPCLPQGQVFTTAVIAQDINNANYEFDGNAFTGIFDGADYKILNLTIDTNSFPNNYLGLFGQVFGGEIKNLGLENVRIAGGNESDYLGGLVGYSNGGIGNCSSTGAITGGFSSNYLGGLIGLNEGSISNCHSKGTVTGGDYSEWLGGLVGVTFGIINNSFSTADVFGGNGAYCLGGLVGYNSNTVSACFAEGNVSGGDSRHSVGGLVGTIGPLGVVLNCYATGEVYASHDVGGLVGINENGTINKCYSSGKVSGIEYAGGLLGWNNLGIISNSFWDINSSTQSSSAGGIGKTTEQMKMLTTFVDAEWDFSTPVWRIYEGRCYPYLAWEKYGGGTGVPTNPYRIWTVAELLAMAADTNDYDKCFLLMNDLDLDPNLSGNKVFNKAVIAPFIYNPPGFQGVAYTGVFDGMGHKIFNLTIEANSSTWNDSIGLIGHVYYGEVKNVGLENVRITCDSNSYSIGGLVGLSYASFIRNCYSTGTIAGGSRTNFAGGLVGYNAGGGWIGDFNSIVNNCYSTCSVTAGDSSEYIGGLAGYNRYIGGNISDCFSAGDVSAGPSSHYVGGLAGENEGVISSSYFLVTSGPNNGCGTPLADEQMKQAGNFVGWDFNDVWHICETTNYPKLIWQILPADIVCPDGVDIFDLAILCEQWLFEKIPADVAPPGGDGIVNFADFAVFADQWGVSQDIDTLLDFAEQWLKVGLPGHSADIWPQPNGDGRVNAADLAVMADYWLQ